MREVACMQHERRALRQRIDSVNGLLQRSRYVLVRFLAETNVAVANLYERKTTRRRRSLRFTHHATAENASAHAPQDTCSGPCHTFEKAAPIDAVIRQVLENA